VTAPLTDREEHREETRASWALSVCALLCFALPMWTFLARLDRPGGHSWLWITAAGLPFGLAAPPLAFLRRSPRSVAISLGGGVALAAWLHAAPWHGGSLVVAGAIYVYGCTLGAVAVGIAAGLVGSMKGLRHGLEVALTAAALWLVGWGGNAAALLAGL
jgi:hypothetical protein